MKVIKEGGHRLFETDVETSAYVSSLLVKLEKGGMEAVRRCSKEFDAWDPPSFELTERQIKEAIGKCDAQLVQDTAFCQSNVRRFCQEQLATLGRLGVGLSEFGERTFLLDALPPFVKVSDARRFILELVDELKATGSAVNTLRLGEQTIAKTVCRHAVKANDPLKGPELERLVADLRQCAMPYTCPHGRPTLIEMNLRELEKKFGRSQ